VSGPSNGIRLLDPHVLRCLLHLCLTEHPSIHWHYPASSVLRTSPPPTRPGLSLESCQLILTTATAGVSRVASSLLCIRVIAITPAGSMGLVRSSISIASGPPPCRLLQLFFRGRLSVHSRYDLHARGVAKRLFTRRSDSFVASAGASISGRSEPVPGRDLHPMKSSVFPRRTVTSKILDAFLRRGFETRRQD